MITTEYDNQPQSSSGYTSFALVFHSSHREEIVTNHIIKDGVIQRGRVISHNSLMSFYQEQLNIRNSINTVELMPENILLANHDKIVWYKKGHVGNMWTRYGRNECFQIHYPTLLFIAEKNSLKVFCLASSKRPTLSSKLYKVPFGNISDNGVMCFGSVKRPKILSIKSIDEYERAFFDSYFSHSGSLNKRVNLSWRKFIVHKANTKERFFARELIYLCRLQEVL